MMENKELFRRDQNGYNCEDVDRYIAALKTEYKKVFEYAKSMEANSEKVKKICRALSDENKALKASGATADVDANAFSDVDRIATLGEELAQACAELKSKIAK